MAQSVGDWCAQRQKSLKRSGDSEVEARKQNMPVLTQRGPYMRFEGWPLLTSPQARTLAAQCQKVADHLAALAIEAPRFSDHLRAGAVGIRKIAHECGSVCCRKAFFASRTVSVHTPTLSTSRWGHSPRIDNLRS